MLPTSTEVIILAGEHILCLVYDISICIANRIWYWRFVPVDHVSTRQEYGKHHYEKE
jgi:hypothetical protein